MSLLQLDCLIDAKELIKLGDPTCPRWDYFVSAYNDSDRVRQVFQQIKSPHKKWFITPEYLYQSDDYPQGDLLPISSVNAHRGAVIPEDEVIITAFKDLLPALSSARRICIDVTGMMRSHILFLLCYLKNSGITSFDMIYTEPEHYKRKADTAFASEDVIEVRQIAGFEGSHVGGTDRDILVIGVGYDHHLISRVIESRAGSKVLELHSLPSLSADMYQESILRLERVSSSYTPALDGKHIYCSANDPFLISAVLAETVSSLVDKGLVSNLYLSPLATKPQAIGFGLFYLKSLNSFPMSMVFPFSSKYERKTANGVGRTWRYPINL